MYTQCRLLTLQRKVYMACYALGYFANHQWIFKNNNILDLLNLVLPEDREAFSCDILNIDVKEFYR